jgi:flagellar basal body-associated protein FliL
VLLLPTAIIAATASGSSNIAIAVGIVILVVVIVIISSFTSNGSSGLRCYGTRRSAPTALGSVGRGGGSRKGQRSKAAAGALPDSCEGPTRKGHGARLVFAKGHR